jgi:chromosome segregation ATPase
MDFWLLLVLLGFVGVLLGAAYFGIAEPRRIRKPKPKEAKTSLQDSSVQPDVYPKVMQLQKELSVCENRRKSLETQLQSLQVELQALKEANKKEQDDKARVDFDRQEAEHQKTESLALRQELAAKEDQLEQAISLRHKQEQQSMRLKIEYDALAKKHADLSEIFQKTESLSEALSRELEQAKKRLSEQEKIVRLHQESKTDGQWVSRQEIDRLHQQISEKEAQIQALLGQRNRPNP